MPTVSDKKSVALLCYTLIVYIIVNVIVHVLQNFHLLGLLFKPLEAVKHCLQFT